MTEDEAGAGLNRPTRSHQRQIHIRACQTPPRRIYELPQARTEMWIVIHIPHSHSCKLPKRNVESAVPAYLSLKPAPSFPALLKRIFNFCPHLLFTSIPSPAFFPVLLPRSSISLKCIVSSFWAGASFRLRYFSP